MIRFNIDGVDYEVDTAAEAAELRKLLGRQRSAKKAATSRWKNSEQAQKPEKPTKISRVFEALAHADHGRMTSDALAKKLDVKPTAIPPLFAHARAWQERVAPGEPFDRFIAKDMDARGNTVFVLTNQGMALVGKFQEVGET